jgi:hypothetical protein
LPFVNITYGNVIAQGIGEKIMPKKCNSLEEIEKYLAINVQLDAQIRGIPPKETFLFFDIELPKNVPNSWDAVDLISHCSPLLGMEVKADE